MISSKRIENYKRSCETIIEIGHLMNGRMWCGLMNRRSNFFSTTVGFMNREHQNKPSIWIGGLRIAGKHGKEVPL